MNFKNYSLVFFTLLIQLNTGILFSYLLVTLLNVNSSDSGYYLKDPLMVWFPFILVLVAMFFSFMHLGRSSNAGFAILNIRSSMLSREIFFVVTFACILLSGLILFYLRALSKTTFVFIYGLAFLNGLILIRVMIKLYRIPTVPPWNTIKTDIAFFNSCLFSGAAAGMIISNIFFDRNESLVSHNVYQFFLAMVCLGLFLHWLMDFLPAKTKNAGTSSFPVPRKPKAWIALKHILLATGVIIILLHFSEILPVNYDQLFMFIAFILVFAGEIISRFQFYHSYYRVGV